MSSPVRTVVRSLILAAVLAALAVPAAQAAPGDLDATFATGGVYSGSFMTTFPGAEDSQTVAIDSLGRAYLSATQEPQLNGGPLRQVNVQRLTPQGQLDTTFGTGGTVTLMPGTDVRNVGVVVDAQDRPVVLTFSGDASLAWQIELTRLTTAGLPDVSFDGDGTAIATALPGTAAKPWPSGIALDKNGGILVSGTLLISCIPCQRPSGFVARFTSAGAPDSTYGTMGGWTPIGDSGTELNAIHALPAGGAVVAAYDNFAEWVVGRLAADGTPDPGFGTNGIARSSLGLAGNNVSAYGVTVDAQGRPLVVGQTTLGGDGAMTIARWTSAGVPDPSFGTGTPTPGVVQLAAAGSRGLDVATQCVDGKIIVLAHGFGLALSRLNDNGTLDPTFAAASTPAGVAGYYPDPMQPNAAMDLALTSASAYATGMRRIKVGDVFTDVPQVLRFSANEACGGGAPVTTPPVTTPPVTTPVTAPVVKPAATIKVADLVAFPSTKKCVSRRRFQIRLRVPGSANVVSADVRVNGKSAGVRKGKRLRSTVDLRNLPKGRFSVQIVLKLKNGKTLKATRRYKTCAPKRRSR